MEAKKTMEKTKSGAGDFFECLLSVDLNSRSEEYLYK